MSSQRKVLPRHRSLLAHKPIVQLITKHFDDDDWRTWIRVYKAGQIDGLKYFAERTWKKAAVSRNASGHTQPAPAKCNHNPDPIFVFRVNGRPLAHGCAIAGCGCQTSLKCGYHLGKLHGPVTQISHGAMIYYHAHYHHGTLILEYDCDDRDITRIKNGEPEQKKYKMTIEEYETARKTIITEKLFVCHQNWGIEVCPICQLFDQFFTPFVDELGPTNCVRGLRETS